LTSLPSKLAPLKTKRQFKRIIQTVFHGKEWSPEIQYLVLGRNKSHFVQKQNYSDSTKKISESDVIKIIVFLIDNTFAMFGGQNKVSYWLS
jgi:hypothetical protein